MFRVICFFTDLEDDGYPYAEGCVFPREGVSVSAKRLAELSGSGNLQGRPLIVAVKDVKRSGKKG
ncbi:MAG: hypothetical protein PHY23_10845 [Oscillospiraceae bacterium]|nr:hypothetical protein [Oscillospiraceae bacterium]MDD4511387.1 hypothetical protein [Oscillospiraceae bacterium]